MVQVRGARERYVLATLVLQGGLVPVDRLVDALWSQPPKSARGQLYNLVNKLRDVVGREVIATRPTGYELVLDTVGSDLHDFRRQVDLARQAAETGDHVHAELALSEAVGLWRGPAMADVVADQADSARAALREELTAAQEARLDSLLALGRFEELVACATPLIEEFPYRERFYEATMLALVAVGRQAEALELYRTASRTFDENLGVEPGTALRDLEHRILRGEVVTVPTKGMPAVEATHGAPVRQLPPSTGVFVGRRAELTVLSTHLRQAASKKTLPVVVISGPGGIGKTALAIEAAQQQVENFADGQLYVDLRGFSNDRAPMAPEEALRGFLTALGVQAERMPNGVDAQGALYRSMLADKDVLVVLDNADGSDQVFPLLPGSTGSTGCAVVVTSRRQLAGLLARHDARLLDLEALPDTDARALVTRYVGQRRAEAEAEALTEVVRWCSGLPIALSVAGARAVKQSSLPLATLVDELEASTTRLDALDGGELTANVRAVFSSSYAALDDRQAKTFCLLGLWPGPNLELRAVACLSACDLPDARRVLAELADRSLVHQHAPGRYRMHDLIRLYAAERACQDIDADERESALRRLVDFFLHSAFAADRVFDPASQAIDLDPPVAGCTPHHPTDPVAALTWFTSEHPNLLAAQHVAAASDWHNAVWRLAWTMDTYHWRRGQRRDRVETWRIGLAAARRVADPSAEILAGRLLGDACALAGESAAAMVHHQDALRLAERTGEVSSQARIHQALSLAFEHRGDMAQAQAHAISGLRLLESLDDPLGIARMHNSVGWFASHVDQFEQAAQHCEAALEIFRQHDHRQGQANTLDSLAHLAFRTGRPEQAIRHYHDALMLFRELGDTYEEADTWERLGEVHASHGQPRQAGTAWLRAFDLYQIQGRQADAERVQARLTSDSARQDQRLG